MYYNMADNQLCKLETYTGKSFLCVSNFQPPRIVNRLEPGLEATYEPPPYLFRRKSCNRLAHASRTRESEQRVFLPGVYQNAFVHVQGSVT